MAPSILETEPSSELEEEEDDEIQQQGGAWDDWESDGDESSFTYLCLFCSSTFVSAQTLFDHCKSQHSFDFHALVKDQRLDFYGSIKLINYIRSQVAEKKCCIKDLANHLHTSNYEKDGRLFWDDDKYLKPFMVDDALLHSLTVLDDDDDDDDDVESINKHEAMMELAELCGDSRGVLEIEEKEGNVDRLMGHFEEVMSNCSSKQKDKQPKFSFAKVAAREIKSVNENYFGSYGSFGIHREMIGDKVRTEAYRDAILQNPSLLKQAAVLDVGCGTGVLSLFAAQAGASCVIAVEASAKMASVATQIAKDNGLLSDGNRKGEQKQCHGVINVVQSMVEDLDNCLQIQPHSFDVLVSEWMGYCLLYESMLSSVLYARDRWLKPGGAILPDTATIFIAGFGRGATCLPFWENVYGLNMSCIGKEVLEDASKSAIVDVVDSRDIVTESATLKFFDLSTMKPDDIDFTATCELEVKSDHPRGASDETSSSSSCTKCHGIVLWFETGFTDRFCRETPVVLSTSPYTQSTHWSQTIFTFQEPIAMTSAKDICDPASSVGTDGCPAVSVRTRISIARSSQHRSIDISVETTGVSCDGRKKSWPVQMFNL